MTPAQVLLNSTDELICTINSSGSILEVNSSWKTFFSNFKITSILDLFNRDLSHELSSLLLNDHFTQKVFPESKIIHPKGDISWMTLKVQVLTKGRYLLIMKDITEEKNLSGILSQVLENYEIGHFRYESETTKLQWSSKIFEMFQKDEAYFSPDLTFMIHAFGDKYIEYLNNVFNSPLSRKIDIILPVHHSNGETSWFNIRAKKTFITPINYSIQGIIQDVTKDKQKEIFQLSQNVEISSYEKGLEKFSIVARTDKYGKITSANEQFCRISKYTQDELIGKDHRIVNSGYHSKSFFKEMWANILNGQSWRGEIKNKAKDGSFYWVDTIIIPIMTPEGELKEVLSFRYEITELKELQLFNKVLKNKLELIVGNQNNLLWYFDFTQRKLGLDYKFIEMLQIESADEMELDTFFSFFLDIDSERLNKFIATKDQIYLELPCKLAMQGYGYRVNFKMRIVRNDAGEAIHLDGICVVTEKIIGA